MAVYCTYEGKRKTPRCCSSSHARRLTGVQGRFLASLEMTIRGKRYSRIVSLLHGEAAFSLLPMEGGAPKGRRLESPRYEREYEESVLSYRHPERSREIFAIRGQGLTLSPHVPRTSPLFSSVFHPARTLSGSLRSPPSPRGEGFIRRYSFSTYACIRFEAMGEAVFSYRSLPHGGRLTIRDMLFFHLFSCPPGCFCFLPSHSPVFPCARKISRYARNDDMGEDLAKGQRFYMSVE